LVPLQPRVSGTPATVNKHRAVLHQGLGADHLVIGCINKLCFVSIILRVRREALHSSLRVLYYVASLNSDCVYAGANLRVGSRVSQLILLLLVIGLSLAPSLVVLMTVVPRDACG
jgi:hypothetical protein